MNAVRHGMAITRRPDKSAAGPMHPAGFGGCAFGLSILQAYAPWFGMNAVRHGMAITRRPD